MAVYIVYIYQKRTHGKRGTHFVFRNCAIFHQELQVANLVGWRSRDDPKQFDDSSQGDDSVQGDDSIRQSPGSTQQLNSTIQFGGRIARILALSHRNVFVPRMQQESVARTTNKNNDTNNTMKHTNTSLFLYIYRIFRYMKYTKYIKYIE